jgi:hypothetical protein
MVYETGKPIITGRIRSYIALWPNSKYTLALFLLFLDVLSADGSTLDNKEVLKKAISQFPLVHKVMLSASCICLYSSVLASMRRQIYVAGPELHIFGRSFSKIIIIALHLKSLTKFNHSSAFITHLRKNLSWIQPPINLRFF